MLQIALAALVAFVVLPRAAWSQAGVPQGPEFRVNTFTTFDQSFADVSFSPTGNDFVVVWAGNGQDGSGFGVFGQRFAASGPPLGPEFRVNTFTPGGQYVAAVNHLNAAGDFVVVWTSAAQDGASFGVFGQRYAGSGIPLGLEFRVNTFTTGFQGYPAVAADSNGNFLVLWHSTQDGSANGIYAQRYASSGVPQGPEFRVNTSTAGEQRFPVVSSRSGPGEGPFPWEWIALWTGQDGSGEGISAQRLESSGVLHDVEYRLNATLSEDQYLADGFMKFFGGVVSWGSRGQDGPDLGDGLDAAVIARRLDANGVPVGGEFRVNTYTTGGQDIPSVSGDSSGNFVITWTSNGQDGSSYGVFGQRFTAAGAPLGPEFRVNTYTTNLQGAQAVAADPTTGNFVVVWQSAGQDGSLSGIYAQRYGQIVPVDLMRFGIE